MIHFLAGIGVGVLIGIGIGIVIGILMAAFSADHRLYHHRDTGECGRAYEDGWCDRDRDLSERPVMRVPAGPGRRRPERGHGPWRSGPGREGGAP